MASWAEEFLARQQGQQQAKQAGSADLGYIGGFVSSGVSSIGELFGMNPFPSAEEFRQENPVSGIVSELTGAIVPYAGWEAAIAKVPKIAQGIDRAVSLTKLSPVTQPVRHGMASMAIRYAPVELSRLGVGLFTTDDWDKYQGLFADVALTTMLAGGIGGIGGFLRSGGKRSLSDYHGRVAEAPIGLAAPFEYRLSFSPSANVIGEVPMETVQNRLVKEIFTERPMKGGPGATPARARAVTALENSEEPKAVVALSSLFNLSKPGAKKGLIRQPLMQADGTWTLDEAGNQELLGGLGFKSMVGPDGLAAASRFPTLVDVATDRAAGTIKKALDGLDTVADGVRMGREADGGLFIIARRLKASDEAIDETTGLKRFLGVPAPIKAGDRWFITKTDKPHLFVPEMGKTAQLTFNQFAKFREAFQPQRVGPSFFNDKQNLMLAALTPDDVKGVMNGTLKRDAFRAKVGERLTSKMGEATGLKGTEVTSRIADSLYDVLAPTMFKELRNPLFGRLFSMLRLNAKEGDSFVNQMLGGAVKVSGRPFGKNVQHTREAAPGVATLSDLVEQLKPSKEDLQTVFHVGMSKAPAEELANLTKDGLVSPAARGLLDGIARLDQHFWQNMMPVAETTGQAAKFSLLKGPYIPRLYKGDTFVPVYDADGKTLKFLASGRMAQAKHEAKVFVQKANEMGLNYKAGQSFGFHDDQIQTLHTIFAEQALKDPKIEEIAKATAKQIALEGAGMRSGLLRGGTPKTLTEERSGILGSPDFEDYTVKDLFDSVGSHYRMVARNLGYESWRQRWLPEAYRLKNLNSTMFNDLNRRARMMLGYEGSTAKVLNKVLAPVFGPALGGKAATKIASETNKLMYHWNIGILNPTFALVNLLTPLQTVAPWIALMKSAPGAAEDLMHVGLRYGPDGKPAGVFNNISVAKVMGKTLKELGKPGDELAEHVGRAKTDGSLSPQLYEFAFGEHGVAAQGIRGAYDRAGGGVAGSWEAMKSIATYASRHTEEWSRMYAFTAGHIVGRDLFGLTGEALYRFAQRATHVTMYGYHAMDRSLMFTGPIGSMFGLFKNWQMHFIGSMMQYAGLAWRENIWGPLIWQFAGSLAVGGLGATPLVLAADQIAKWASDDPNSFLWMQKEWPNAADEIYYGFPALFGASLQASSALPGTDVRNDLSMLSNFVFLERAKAAWKATSGAWAYAEENGRNPLKDPNIRDALLQGYAPRALFRLFASAEGDFIKSMSTGYPQVRDVSPIGKLAYGLGFNPVEVEREQDAANYLWKNQEAQRGAIQQLGSRFAQAALVNDGDEMDAVVNLAVARGIPVSSVVKSAQTRMRREEDHDLMTKFGASGFDYRDALQDR